MMITTPLIFAVLAGSTLQPGDLPVVKVTTDDFVITKSCVIEIPPGTVIKDEKNDGVLQIKEGVSNITVAFKPGTVLRGAPEGTPGDELRGTGIRLNGAKGVIFRNLNVQGYKVGLHATKADGLTLENSEFRDNFRQHLRSTPTGEDGADWLSPHHGDRDEWIVRWGAAVYVKNAENVTIRDVVVRDTQNGILINRVNKSKIYDNDSSFLSGWGLGMFRSSDNIISRNALDFCVRGHVEGVYNRGQDSAGILCFEQCSNNVFAENSATHGGDGFFAFAGLEALNGEGAPADFDHTRKGCNNNLFIGNDFSYAPAHGLELTFSFGNVVVNNRFVENAICGVWGGYSQDFLIADNLFEGNGGMAYGLERGGVNIEHGAGNRIIKNKFINNRCGVHLWWDGHGDFEEKTWGKANYRGVTDNIIAGNVFLVDSNHPFRNLRADDKLIDLHLRDDAKPVRNVKGTVFADNEVTHLIPQATGIVATAGIEVEEKSVDTSFTIPKHEVLGKKKPVGARSNLRGRGKIIMTEWGPWDHSSPMIRVRSKSGTQHVYDVFGGDPQFDHHMKIPGIKIDIAEGVDGVPLVLKVSGEPGVHAYSFPIKVGRTETVLQGLIIGAEWTLTAFPWELEKTDPRQNLEGWRALANSDKAVTTKAATLRFPYGGGGPGDQASLPQEFREKAQWRDHFGTIATSTFTLPKGKWRFRTVSDDGIRVTVNGKKVIEDWTWHAPKRDQGTFVQDADGEVTVVVEHFEIDGHSALELDIEQAE